MDRVGDGKKKGMGDENMREWDCQVGGRVRWKSKERNISIEGNWMLRKFPGVQKDDPNEDS